jgi:hypothetical protein
MRGPALGHYRLRGLASTAIAASDTVRAKCAVIVDESEAAATAAEPPLT